MRKEGSPFPTERGITLAKDVWMLGIGLGLVIDAATQDGQPPARGIETLTSSRS